MIQDKLIKIETGIPGFEVISRGGLPSGRSTLVSGTSGSCKTMMILQYIVNGITKFNEPGVIVTFEETPDEIKKNMQSFGWHIDKYEKEGKLAFVDVSPEPSATFAIAGDYDFSALLVRIEHAVKKVSAKRVGIDSVGAIFSHFSDPGLIRRELLRISVGLKKMGITALTSTERIKEYGEIARYGVEEFAADNVIILRNVLDDEKRRRTIEILKYRGSDHQKGEFPFTISDNGIEILPLSAMELTQRSSDVRISSGNAELNKMCGSGFFRDSIILISGATGTGKTLLVTTFVNEACSSGEKTLLFAFEESRDQLLRNAIGWGLDFRQWEKKGLLKVICAYPETLGLEDHLLNMKKEIEQFKPKRIAVDSLSALERVTSHKSFREFVVGLTSFIKEKESAGLFTATTASLMGGTSITEQHISTITDSIILLRYVELLGEMRRGLTVLKMRGSVHDKAIREYSIDGEGLHMGQPFQNISGILAGSPSTVMVNEQAKMASMFQNE